MLYLDLFLRENMITFQITLYLKTKALALYVSYTSIVYSYMGMHKYNMYTCIHKYAENLEYCKIYIKNNFYFEYIIKCRNNYKIHLNIILIM